MSVLEREPNKVSYRFVEPYTDNGARYDRSNTVSLLAGSSLSSTRSTMCSGIPASLQICTAASLKYRNTRNSPCSRYLARATKACVSVLLVLYTATSVGVPGG